MVDKAVLYLRSSKDRSDVSIDAQRRSLMEMAQSRGFVVVGEYTDAVESGKDENRPGFQNLLQDIRSTAESRSWNHIITLDTSRISRRRVLSVIFEEQECKRHGIRVVYKSLPDADPITEMLLKSVLQAMDEWHSLTSKVKGMAGMAENVRQGYRAGGPAPRGYRLQTIETGAIRDGAPVTKTKLIPAEDAIQIRAYLQYRAKGITRRRALQLAQVDIPITTLIGMERNALTYAGHTVWNRHAERDGSKYIGEEKWKSKSEWVIQRNTHDALLSDTEAEAILAMIEAKKRSGGPRTRRIYVLTGLLFTPSGEAWRGDDGFYRLGKGKRIAAHHVEAAIVDHTIHYFQSDEIASAIAQHYRTIATEEKDTQAEKIQAKRRIADIDKKTFRLADLVSQTSAPTALLRQIEVLEAEREQIIASLEAMDMENAAAQAYRNITAKDVQRALSVIVQKLEERDSTAVKDMLVQMIDRVELDPATFEAVITYRVAASDKTGEQMVLTRGFEPLLPT